MKFLNWKIAPVQRQLFRRQNLPLYTSSLNSREAGNPVLNSIWLIVPSACKRLQLIQCCGVSPHLYVTGSHQSRCQYSDAYEMKDSKHTSMNYVSTFCIIMVVQKHKISLECAPTHTILAVCHLLELYISHLVLSRISNVGITNPLNTELNPICQ